MALYHFPSSIFPISLQHLLTALITGPPPFPFSRVYALIRTTATTPNPFKFVAVCFDLLYLNPDALQLWGFGSDTFIWLCEI
jgi:hypothetical protein